MVQLKCSTKALETNRTEQFGAGRKQQDQTPCQSNIEDVTTSSHHQHDSLLTSLRAAVTHSWTQ